MDKVALEANVTLAAALKQILVALAVCSSSIFLSGKKNRVVSHLNMTSPVVFICTVPYIVYKLQKVTRNCLHCATDIFSGGIVKLVTRNLFVV